MAELTVAGTELREELPMTSLPMERNNLQIFHINLNVRDLEASARFYAALGFRIVNDFGVGGVPTEARRVGDKDPALPRILGVDPDSRSRAILMRLGEDPRATLLDLIQWEEPRTGGEPAHMSQAGMARLCFKVKDADGAYAAAQAAGAQCLSEPLTIDLGGTRQKVFCCLDPDGAILEFMEFIKTGKRESSD
ncbi:MAG: VOC family protein [Minwuia sp.]|uniref:VOC family protein n=1 Tax=Minwuia sp. TaxID=2493630 RepID=UPI003A8366D7